MIPGQIVVREGTIEVVPDRPTRTLRVRNTGDRPIQIGSHFHLAEANAALAFDRQAAWGFRLAVPAGTSVRFEPGLQQDVEIVAFGGHRIAAGFRGLCAGRLDDRKPDDG
ncbi:MAG: urease subunit beta [Actinobacteria bacterium]|nr:urease subunit beta [Actinomycetota bacterium]